MGKIKLYRVTDDLVSLKEAKWLRTRYSLIGFLFGAIILWVVLIINQNYNDVLGLGFTQEKSLINENRILQNQLKFLNKRLEEIQKKLAFLGDKGNELRLLTNLPKIDEDIMKVGIGGSEEKIDFTSSNDLNSLINNLRFTTDKIDRELKLQLHSYSEVMTKYEQNKTKFAHLPAIKPMDGFFRYDFGLRVHPILGILRPHEGIDIVNEIGTPVYATGDGIVEYSGRKVGYGLTIEIDHGYEYKTIYAHLSKCYVQEGQKVKRGDLIARSGNSGLSVGPHLHYEVRLNGVAQNPIDYFFDDIKITDLK